VTSPLALTLQIALLATVVAGALVLALVIATHGRSWAVALDAVLTAPLVLPPTVLGYYLLVAFGAHGMLGEWWRTMTGGPLVFTRTAAVLAATVTSLPLILQGTRAAMDAVNPTLLEAARTLGAVPLASRGIAAGLLLGFARACGDFGVTLMLAGNIPGETRTASLALYDAVLAGRDDDAQMLALSLTAVAVVAIGLVQWLGRRAHRAS
jgi:molybdate transport system permease protein